MVAVAEFDRGLTGIVLAQSLLPLSFFVKLPLSGIGVAVFLVALVEVLVFYLLSLWLRDFFKFGVV